jgi:hypothetical protein
MHGGHPAESLDRIRYPPTAIFSLDDGTIACAMSNSGTSVSGNSTSRDDVDVSQTWA